MKEHDDLARVGPPTAQGELLDAARAVLAGVQWVDGNVIKLLRRLDAAIANADTVMPPTEWTRGYIVARDNWQFGWSGTIRLDNGLDMSFDARRLCRNTFQHHTQIGRVVWVRDIDGAVTGIDPSPNTGEWAMRGDATICELAADAVAGKA